MQLVEIRWRKNMLDRLERHSSALKTVAALAAAAAAAVILVFGNGRSGTAIVSRPFIALVALPWAIFFAAWLPLIYLSWFRDAKPGMTTSALKAFYYGLVLATLLIFGGMYVRLLFS